MKPEELAERLARLEKSLRLWRWVGLALVLSIGALALGARPSGGTRMGELIIVDSSGRERIVLGTDDEGLPICHFLDGSDRPRLVLGLTGNGEPVVEMRREGGQPQIGMTVREPGIASIILRDLRGECRSEWLADALGNSALLFDDVELRERIAIAVDPDGKASLEIRDAEGLALAQVAAPAEQPPSIVVRGGRGGGSAKVSFLEEAGASPFFSVLDADDHVGAAMGLGPTGPGLTLTDSAHGAIAILAVTPEEGPSLSMKGQPGAGSLGLAVPKGMDPILAIMNAAGKAVWSAPK